MFIDVLSLSKNIFLAVLCRYSKSVRKTGEINSCNFIAVKKTYTSKQSLFSAHHNSFLFPPSPSFLFLSCTLVLPSLSVFLLSVSELSYHPGLYCYSASLHLSVSMLDLVVFPHFVFLSFSFS